MQRKLAGLLGSAAVALWLGQAHAADLNVWGLQAFNPEADAYIGELVKEYGKSKNISAEYVVVPANVLNEKLAAAFAANAPPDVFMNVSAQGLYYMSQGLTTPLDDVLADMRKVSGGIYENTMPQATYEGKVQALPIEIDVSPMYARKDLLAKVNMPIPATWEDLRKASQAILKTDPTIQAFGFAVSNTNDAEGSMRQVIWSYGGAMFDKEGKTVTFNSPETIAAYQFIADMVAEGTIPRAALTWDDAGNNNAYQTGRSAFIINPPSVYSWMQANDKDLLKNTALINVPKGPGAKGKAASSIGSWLWLVPKSSKQIDNAKGWLRYFYEPTRYQKIIQTVGGRWLPVYPSMMSMPLFKDNPDYANFGAMAASGIIDGYEAPPSAWASKVNNAKVVTNVLQKILVDKMPAKDAVAWGQAEIEKLK
jgi:multiple sugar transport system substrate-binding protein